MAIPVGGARFLYYLAGGAARGPELASPSAGRLERRLRLDFDCLFGFELDFDLFFVFEFKKTVGF